MCKINGFELGRESDLEDVVSFFKKIEGEIDEIAEALRTQEWEHAGMIYFMDLCGRKIPPGHHLAKTPFLNPAKNRKTQKRMLHLILIPLSCYLMRPPTIQLTMLGMFYLHLICNWKILNQNRMTIFQQQL